jgi:hypothetical protein
MDDETFLMHWNKRHRKTDSTFVGNLPYSPHSTSYTSLRAFHIHCHYAEQDGGTINTGNGPFTPAYDHEHMR